MKHSKFFLLAAMALLGSHRADCQTLPVDADGVKVVELGAKDKFAKQFSSKERDLVKTLVIKDAPGSESVADFWEMYKVISKFTCLEAIDVSGCKALNEKLFKYNYKDSKGNPIVINGIKIVTIAKGDKDGFPYLDMNDYGLSMLPQLEEVKITGAGEKNDKAATDSLFFNVECGSNFVPVRLLKEGAELLKKVESYGSVKCQVLFGGKNTFMPSNSNLEGAVIVENKFICAMKPKNLRIPSSVRSMVGGHVYKEDGCEIDNLVFDEGDSNLSILEDAFDGINVKKSIIFNRPTYMLCPGRVEEMDSLVFNKDVEISNYSHTYGSKFRKISSVVFNANAKIGKEWYEGGLSEPFGTMVFKGNTVLEQNAIGNVEIMTFYSEPKCQERAVYNVSKMYVPKGVKNKLAKVGTGVNSIMERDPYAKLQARTLKLDKPGQLLSVISPEDLADTDSLTISGFMYETDTKIISDVCTSLRYLNLSDAIITISPKQQEENAAEAAFFSGLFSLIGAGLDAQYKNGELGTTDYVGSRLLTELFAQSDKEEKGIEQSIVPGGLLKNKETLEEVVLPRTATSIYVNCFSDCENLKKVTFPKYLKTIGDNAFNGTRLEEIVLPQSVEYIGGFHRCLNLKKIDYSACTVSSISLGMDDLKNIQEIRLPKVPKGRTKVLYPRTGCKIYIPEECANFDFEYYSELKNGWNPWGIEADGPLKIDYFLHFASQNPPHLGGHSLKGTTIYCPKGAITTYYSKFGSNNKIVEE